MCSKHKAIGKKVQIVGQGSADLKPGGALSTAKTQCCLSHIKRPLQVSPRHRTAVFFFVLDTNHPNIVIYTAQPACLNLLSPYPQTSSIATRAFYAKARRTLELRMLAWFSLTVMLDTQLTVLHLTSFGQGNPLFLIALQVKNRWA